VNTPIRCRECEWKMRSVGKLHDHIRLADDSTTLSRPHFSCDDDTVEFVTLVSTPSSPAQFTTQK
jgi:hypothetical protein